MKVLFPPCHKYVCNQNFVLFFLARCEKRGFVKSDKLLERAALAVT